LSSGGGILSAMPPGTADSQTTRPHIDHEATTCPRCGESHDLAKVKGCIKCLKCGFKFDCNGW
jgi:ribosomal protein S27AE